MKETEEVTVNTLSQDFFGDFSEVNKLSVSQEQLELSPLMVAKLGQP